MAQRQFRTDDTEVWADRYGSGSDGALTVSGSTTWSQTNRGCSGTAASNTLTLASAGFTDGDLILIHKSRGNGTTSAGNWELNKVASGGGTTTLTLAYPLLYTYIDSGDDQSQVIRIPQYTNVTIDNGVTLSVSAWDQSVGGILVFCATGTTTINGTISASGSNGTGTTSEGITNGATGGGYVGGRGKHNRSGDQAPRAFSGEGTVGAQLTNTDNLFPGMYERGDNAGSGSTFNNGEISRSGGGGGNGTVGNAGTNSVGGIVVGNAALTIMDFGGGGGGGSRGWNINGGSGSGGSGGGIVIIISKNITINNTTGAINSIGGTGGRGTSTEGQAAEGGGSDGGSGAGGSILLKGQVIDIGSSRITATGGPGNSASGGRNSAGGNGRVHVDYSQSLNGTANPTLDSSVDNVLNNLTEASNYFIFM